MRVRYLIPVFCAILLAGAGVYLMNSESENATSTTSSSSATAAQTSSSTTTPPITPPTVSTTNPVYNDSVWLARSTDGDSFTLDAEVLIEHASVPNLTRFETAVGEFAAGTLMIVYVDATTLATSSNGTERTGRYVSEDNGVTWEYIGPVTYVGADGHVPVDPNLVQLPDGTLRMYYFDFSQTIGGVVLSASENESHFYAADSTDGETFTLVGEVFSDVRITDPEVIINDGTYTMFYAWHDDGDGGIGAATSSDGLAFEKISVSGEPVGIPGALLDGDTIELYGCGLSGITRYYGDTTLTFGSAEAISTDLKAGFCDPDPVKFADGSYLLVVKKLQPISKN